MDYEIGCSVKELSAQAIMTEEVNTDEGTTVLCQEIIEAFAPHTINSQPKVSKTCAIFYCALKP